MIPTKLTDEQIARVLTEGSAGLEYEDTGPGKFEGNTNPGLASRLYDCTLDSWYDEQVGSVDENGYWSALMGRFVVTEDDRGFFSYEEFPSDWKAREHFRLIDPYVEESER